MKDYKICILYKNFQLAWYKTPAKSTGACMKAVEIISEKMSIEYVFSISIFEIMEYQTVSEMFYDMEKDYDVNEKMMERYLYEGTYIPEENIWSFEKELHNPKR